MKKKMSKEGRKLVVLRGEGCLFEVMQVKCLIECGRGGCYRQ